MRRSELRGLERLRNHRSELSCHRSNRLRLNRLNGMRNNWTGLLHLSGLSRRHQRSLSNWFCG